MREPKGRKGSVPSSLERAEGRIKPLRILFILKRRATRLSAREFLQFLRAQQPANSPTRANSAYVDALRPSFHSVRSSSSSLPAPAPPLPLPPLSLSLSSASATRKEQARTGRLFDRILLSLSLSLSLFPVEILVDRAGARRAATLRAIAVSDDARSKLN